MVSVIMKTRITILSLIILFATTCCGQSELYRTSIKKAEQYVAEKNYKNATTEYSNAFRSLGWKGNPQDRYNAAKAWTLCSVKDSAFFNLLRLLDKTDFLEYHSLIRESDFTALHTDDRWKKILTELNPNDEKFNDSLSTLLSQIYDDDQKYRSSIEEYQSHKAEAKYQDSADLAKVCQILFKNGWLSINEVGKKGNTTLWVVLQHAPLEIMEKYLPVLQTAVKKGKASKKNLAYFQDRILMYQNKKQLYGTQYKVMNGTKETILWDVEDPDNLNKRRESMGLPPMDTDKK